MAKKKQPHYRVNIDWSDEDKCFIARVPELPGCATDGETYLEAAKNVQEAIESYLGSLQDMGKPAPEPLAHRKFSGKVALRIREDLHRDATAKAMIERKSLNQFIETVLEKAVGE